MRVRITTFNIRTGLVLTFMIVTAGTIIKAWSEIMNKRTGSTLTFITVTASTMVLIQHKDWFLYQAFITVTVGTMINKTN